MLYKKIVLLVAICTTLAVIGGIILLKNAKCDFYCRIRNKLLMQGYEIDDYFYKNYFVKRQIYAFFIKEVKLGDLWATTFRVPGGRVGITDDRNMRYVYLLDKERYRNMYNASYNKSREKYNSNNYDKLIEKVMSNDFKYDIRPIIVEGGSNIILDGQHRASVLAYKYGLQHKIKVIMLYSDVV